MAEMRDVYIHSQDNSDAGLSGKMSRLSTLLHLHDPELWQHLNETRLDPTHYSLRWITTLFAREFTLVDTIRLWDTFFSEGRHVDFLSYFCLAMILAQRSALLQGDFGRCLYLLQQYPVTEASEILRQAKELQAKETPCIVDPPSTWWL